MADDDKTTVMEVRSVAERQALERLNAALGLPKDTPYATLASPTEMQAIIDGTGKPASAAAPEPASAPLAPAPVAEPVAVPREPAPAPEPIAASPAVPAVEPAAPKASATVQEAESRAEGKFASFIRNEQGKIRKGPAFAVAAVSLAAAAYGVHKLREQKQEAPSR